MSLSFTGSNSPYSYLSIPNSSSLYLGTGDYTIQWWQYQTDSNLHPRVFAIGNYPTQIFGVSIEGSGTSYIFYLWTPSATNSFSLNTSQYKNQWVHFAITRTSSTLRIFLNGVQQYTTTNTQNISGFSQNLAIAQEATPSTSSGFGGYTYNPYKSSLFFGRNEDISTVRKGRRLLSSD